MCRSAESKNDDFLSNRPIFIIPVTTEDFTATGLPEADEIIPWPFVASDSMVYACIRCHFPIIRCDRIIDRIRSSRRIIAIATPTRDLLTENFGESLNIEFNPEAWRIPIYCFGCDLRLSFSHSLPVFRHIRGRNMAILDRELLIHGFASTFLNYFRDFERTH